MTPNNIDCIPGQLKVKQVKSRPIVVNFHSETVTSDARVSLIAEIDRKRKMTSRLAECFKDYRIGLDVALEALRECLQKRKCSMDEIWHYAKICRVHNVMRPYLESLT